jgi:hypothetical protein
MWSDTLTSREAAFTARAIEALNGINWAQPILNRLQQAGGLKSKNMPLMFEVRFAYELHRAGKVAEYEYNAGVGESTVEFRVAGGVTWLIELVSIRTSQAAKNAITQHGLIYQQILSTDATDVAQSPEAEMITAEQKIGEKVFTNGAQTKFPVPANNVYHIILSDMRGYLIDGGDVCDYRQMAYGPSGIPSKYSWTINYWKKEGSKLEPIKGLFEKCCPLRSARFIQERIHFLGFIREREYIDGEIPQKALYLPNPHLLANEEVVKLYESFPLRTTGIEST